MSDGGYGAKHVVQLVANDGTADLVETTGDAPADQITNLKFREAGRIVQIGLEVTETVATDATLGVIAFDTRPTIGSDTGRVDGASATGLGTLTVPDLLAAGSLLVKEVDFDVAAGVQVVPEVTTAGVDAGTEAGEFLYTVWYVPNRKVAADETKVTLSA